jgi:hypothetical protein
MCNHPKSLLIKREPHRSYPFNQLVGWNDTYECEECHDWFMVYASAEFEFAQSARMLGGKVPVPSDGQSRLGP